MIYYSIKILTYIFMVEGESNRHNRCEFILQEIILTFISQNNMYKQESCTHKMNCKQSP